MAGGTRLLGVGIGQESSRHLCGFSVGNSRSKGAVTGFLRVRPCSGRDMAMSVPSGYVYKWVKIMQQSKEGVCLQNSLLLSPQSCLILRGKLESQENVQCACSITELPNPGTP